jgi:hypothetical protein
MAFQPEQRAPARLLGEQQLFGIVQDDAEQK